MTTMDRLVGLLDDVDELLDHADAQTITESLERGEAPDHVDVTDWWCRWCGCGFHGLACYVPPEYVGSWFEPVDDAALTITAPGGFCRCDSALARLDDTWRPFDLEPSERDHLALMDETGMDGWAARVELITRKRAEYVESLRRYHQRNAQQARENRNRILCRHMDETGLDGWAAMADRQRPRGDRMHLEVSFDAAALQTVFAQVGAATQAIVGEIRVGLVSVGQLMANVSGIWLAPAGTPAPVDDGNDPPLAEWERALVELPEPTVQERALQLRRTRNTGPERPSAGRARRPRRHGG